MTRIAGIPPNDGPELRRLEALGVEPGFRRLIAHMDSRAAGRRCGMAHTAAGSQRHGAAPDKLDARFARLREHWREEQIFETAGVAALFGFLKRWNDTPATPPKDHPVAVAQRHLAPHGWTPGKHQPRIGARP